MRTIYLAALLVGASVVVAVPADAKKKSEVAKKVGRKVAKEVAESAAYQGAVDAGKRAYKKARDRKCTYPEGRSGSVAGSTPAVRSCR